FETAFIRAGIPYRIVGTLRFYEREEIKDAIAVLRFLVNSRDVVSFSRIINKPARGIGPKTVQTILRQPHDADLLLRLRSGSLSLSARASASVSNFVQIFENMQLALRNEEFQNLGDFMHFCLVETGLLEFHQQQDEISGFQKVLNLEELENAASEHSGTFDGAIAFLEQLELDTGVQLGADDSLADDADAVTLITMHNTKGLEFDRVFISGMEDGLFPRESDLDPESLEEERRLLYVAITRARKELYFTSVSMRRIHGRLVDLPPSRFLSEIPQGLLENYFEGTDDFDNGSEYPKGCGVYHDDYGTGRVIQSEYRDGVLVVMVQFETGRKARFLPAYSPLERVCLDD
ncbi:MAG: DNA/RNA helicase, partial [Spirochaetaceae bacterium]